MPRVRITLLHNEFNQPLLIPSVAPEARCCAEDVEDPDNRILWCVGYWRGLLLVPPILGQIILNAGAVR